MKLNQICEIKIGQERIWSVDWDENENLLVTCGADKSARVWSFDSAKPELKMVAELEGGHTRTIRSAQFNKKNGNIATASFDGTVCIWKRIRSSKNDVGEKYELSATLEGHENEVKAVSWSPSGRFLATCSRDKTIWIWLVESGSLGVGGDEDEFECIAVLQEHTQDVKMVKWKPQVDELISCSYDDTIKVWLQDDDNNGEDEEWYCGQTLSGHKSTVWAVDADETGKRIVSVSEDRSIRVWEQAANNGRYKCVFTKDELHERAIYTVSCCPLVIDQKFLIASAGGDDKIILTILPHLDIPTSSNTDTITIDSAHESDINCISWKHDTRTKQALLASVGDDGKLKIWCLTW